MASDDLHEARQRIQRAGWGNPAGLVRKSLDLLGAALQGGREPSKDELIQSAALLLEAAEKK